MRSKPFFLSHCISFVPLYVVLQRVDEEFGALEGFFYVLEHGILKLLENVETYLHHLQVGCMCSSDDNYRIVLLLRPFKCALNSECAPFREHKQVRSVDQETFLVPDDQCGNETSGT